jgi:hypothetical protein
MRQISREAIWTTSAGRVAANPTNGVKWSRELRKPTIWLPSGWAQKRLERFCTATGWSRRDDTHEGPNKPELCEGYEGSQDIPHKKHMLMATKIIVNLHWMGTHNPYVSLLLMLLMASYFWVSTLACQGGSHNSACYPDSMIQSAIFAQFIATIESFLNYRME